MENYIDDKLLSVLRDDEKMEKFFENFDEEKLKNFLTYIHSRALKIDFEKDAFAGIDMVCGKCMGVPLLVSPPQEIQQKSLKNIAEALKNTPGRINKAMLLHYLTQQLHLFSDGNGRTSRALLEVFLNAEFDFNRSEVVKHDEYNESKVSSKSLERQYGINADEAITDYASYIVYRSLLKSGMLDEQLDKVCILQMTATAEGSAHISPEVKSELSAEQVHKVARALLDGTGKFCPSALTMLVMKKRLGQDINLLNVFDAAEKYEGAKSLKIASFRINTDERENFEGWKKEDYLLLREVYEKIKEMAIDSIIDIFEKPENFKLNENTTFLDIFNVADSPLLTKQMRHLWESVELNLDGTRTQKHLDSLSNLLGKEHPLENIEEPISVQELCEHTLQQQMDCKGKDEFRQLESKLARLEADLNRAESKSL